MAEAEVEKVEQDEIEQQDWDGGQITEKENGIDSRDDQNDGWNKENQKRKADDSAEEAERETKRVRSTDEESEHKSGSSDEECNNEAMDTAEKSQEAPTSDRDEKITDAEKKDDEKKATGCEDKETNADVAKKLPVELKVPTVKPTIARVKEDAPVLNLSKKTVPLEVPKPTLNGKAPDSDKENDVTDAPIDLSKGGKPSSHSASPDVIMLSDEEDDLPRLVNGMKDYSPEEVAKTRRAIRKLQEELRNEESKLVLLKKIRQSQVMLPNQINKITQPQPHSHQSQSVSRGGQQPSHAHNHPKQSQGMQSQMHRNQLQQVHNRSHSNQNQSQMTMAHQKSQQLQQMNRGSSSSSSNRESSSSNVANYRQPTQPPAKPAPPPQPEQSPAQRQAAAKLALRKQLEKTLLQIPPPKPPPPEMNFLPSASSGDFIPLVGLEEVVKYIVETDAKTKGGKGPEVKYVFNPFTCVQCGTDFTPVWKRDKPGSKNVICEQCVTNNQKKALKQEHTNRLKSAFVKALQQEQEIEQRMLQAEKQQQREKTSTPSSSQAHHQSTSQSQSTHHHQSQPSPAHSNSTSSSSSSRSSHSRESQGAINLASQYNKATAEQFRQHQSLLQAHQAQLRALGLSGLQNLQNFQHLAFPFQPQLTAKQAAELQRQYLLDMIQPRSLPGGGANNLWRK